MNGLEEMLYIVLVILIFLVIGLAVVYVMLRKKEKQQSKEQEEQEIISSEFTTTQVSTTTKIAKEYDKKSVFDFMEFDSIKDNMIVQKGGKKFLLAIECKGVNYDLMSDVEKASTEQGFSSFLNTLREPIQIYIQTRTINLEKNISEYKDRVNKLRDDISLKEFKLKEYAGRKNVNEKVLREKEFELLREKNLYSYGADIITDTKRMSLNKNVLKKKYYIIISYFYEPSDASTIGILSDAEIREMAFSNLYTKAVAIIRVLSGIGIIGKALNSFELAELLYNAYNRDDSEVFSVEKAIEAGYDELYVDTESVIGKKIEALRKEVQLRAKEEAQKALEQVLDERSEELKNIENNIDNIIEELAKQMILDESENIPEDVKKETIEKIEKKSKSKKKEVEKSNGKQTTKESSGKRRAG